MEKVLSGPLGPNVPSQRLSTLTTSPPKSENYETMAHCACELNLIWIEQLCGKRKGGG